MLSTKNIPDSKLAKTFGPGNQKAKINRIELQPGYNPGSYQVKLFLESEDLGPDFEGFFIDPVAQTDRYVGQVGTVRMSAYAFEDGSTKTGVKVNRDQSILRGLMNLAKALGVSEELDTISADTIEEFVPLASEVLSKNGKFLNFCLAGKEYVDKGGYTKYDLFLPTSKGGQYAYEAVDAVDSKLMKFDPSAHLIRKAPVKPVEEFAAAKDDFDI